MTPSTATIIQVSISALVLIILAWQALANKSVHSRITEMRVDMKETQEVLFKEMSEKQTKELCEVYRIQQEKEANETKTDLNGLGKKVEDIKNKT